MRTYRRPSAILSLLRPSSWATGSCTISRRSSLTTSPSSTPPSSSRIRTSRGPPQAWPTFVSACSPRRCARRASTTAWRTRRWLWSWPSGSAPTDLRGRSIPPRIRWILGTSPSSSSTACLGAPSKRISADSSLKTTRRSVWITPVTSRRCTASFWDRRRPSTRPGPHRRTSSSRRWTRVTWRSSPCEGNRARTRSGVRKNR